MTATDWIIDIVLIAIVIRQLREERLTVRFVIIPAAIVFVVARNYLEAIPTAGNDLLLIGGFAAFGAVLGLVGGLLTRVRAKDGSAYVQAGKGAAALWIGSMTARLGFIIWLSSSSGRDAIASFSRAHDITSGTAWQDALVLLALGEVIVRIGTIVVRGYLATLSERSQGRPASLVKTNG